MDTIIYVYLDRNYAALPEKNVDAAEKQIRTSYYKKEFSMGDYRLVQVGVSPDFLRILQGKEPAQQECGCGKARGEACGGTICGKTDGQIGNAVSAECNRKKRRFSRRHEKAAERLRQQRLAEEQSLRQTFLQELLSDRDRSSFFFEEQIPFLSGWQFNCYLEEEWVQHMMRYTSLHHFLFLGRVNFMPRLILPYVKKMKSMRWILPERQYGTGEQALVEDIYEQYGLPVEVQLLKGEKDYRKMRLTGSQPVMLVDFSEEEKVSAADLPAGSIWLDMGASEAKRQRMEEREQRILYFSLKKEWKQPQKALIFLDTTHKNGYNT